ncbi:hypothetical protein Moror_7431 [Moniliophthora roreri MCA 2997]|uniref:Sister chromatid cohesion protein dcc1 n=1 Tax=Moniliophthora roreri (strain MCA 2997) TaxID=1381753 RepID=V2XT96_MONRO|nr:hypothetical protein Moror_7431 [Moniliophthora roreri MCA 2997]
MFESQLCFSASSSADEGSFKLLELPAELCKIFESSLEAPEPVSFTVKGQSGDDAVLCTRDRTYALRSVALSNTLLVVTPAPYGEVPDVDNALVIHDQINEILELTPIVPKLHKLSTLLKGKEYGQDHEDEDMEADDGTKRVSYAQLREAIQASDAELDSGLKGKRILDINGDLRPIAPSYLSHIIELILNTLVSHSIDSAAASVEKLSSALADNHEIPRTVSTQIMSWFGEIEDGRWQMDAESIVKEAGLSVLRPHQTNPITVRDLTEAWKEMVGDTFASIVSLDLLSGNYLMNGDLDTLTYFPAASLPVDPAPRFADLFLVRSRWKSEDIAPFLSDIAVNSKERDKLLLKYARATTDSTGIWYTSRTQYGG